MTTENAKMYNEESRDKLLQIFLNSPFNALPLCGTWQAKDRHTHRQRERVEKSEGNVPHSGALSNKNCAKYATQPKYATN